MAAAALFHSIVHNHPFHNGNKRTALVALVVLLDRHGYVLKVTEDELYNYVLRLSRHDIVAVDRRRGLSHSDREVLAVAKWVHDNMRRVSKGESSMKFRDLRKTLTQYGCFIGNTYGGYIDIRRRGHRCQIAYDGEGQEVGADTIHKIRHDLQLDEVHGYDSGTFYSRGEKIADFINRYRKILNRLARV